MAKVHFVFCYLLTLHPELKPEKAHNYGKLSNLIPRIKATESSYCR